MAHAARTTRLIGRSSTRTLSGGTAQHANATNKDEEKKTNYPTMRCAFGPIVNILDSMSQLMMDRLVGLGFKEFLGFNLEGIDERGLVFFLMDHLEMNPFRIEVDGRVLPLTPHVVKCVLGIPDGPNALPVISGLEKNKNQMDFRCLCDSKGLKDMYDKRKLEYSKGKDYSALKPNEVHRWVVEEFARKGNSDDWSIAYFFMALFDGLLFPTTSLTLTGDTYL